MDLLIQYGGNINMQTTDGITPLHAASGGLHHDGLGSADLTKLFLAKGANPNIKTKNGYTPLDITSDSRIKQIMYHYLKYI